MLDLIGKRYGRLIVIEKIGSVVMGTKDRKFTMWLCLCDCGNYTKSCTGKLNYGDKTSCGCKPRENIKNKIGNEHPGWKGVGDISGSIFNRIKRCAKDRKIEFSITIEYIWDLYKKQNGKCSLSNLDLYFAKTSKELVAGKNTASLDRIDSSKGYVEGNVQWVHVKINYMKQDLVESEFIEMCELIANNNQIC